MRKRHKHNGRRVRSMTHRWLRKRHRVQREIGYEIARLARQGRRVEQIGEEA